ncbi:hypothetical protein MBLNU459_g5713t2 [Dothideomycetes sp. NU459]
MSLAPPEEPLSNIKDPGAHELADSEDDHFSDASEGQQSKRLSAPASPVPITRVERVDDEPSHGEVPGTAAYNMRTQDAVPDEMEIVPDGQRSRSSSRLSESDRPLTPGGTMIPKMVVERVDEEPSHGEVPGTAAYDMRQADAQPDVVVQAPDVARLPLEGEPELATSPQNGCLTKKGSPTVHDRSPTPVDAHDGQPQELPQAASGAPGNDDYDEFNDGDTQQGDDGGFGDDFDDFEEGAEGDDDDFGDFDDGFQQSEGPAQSHPAPSMPSAPDPLAHLPNLDFESLNTPRDILSTISPYMADIFPEIAASDQLPIANPSQLDHILTDRSASLWSQLVAPPPLQPPNWIRSRIRRLFLVSLGVPVDLDEILPASKQKKLILPNINLPLDSPRQSSQISRLKDQNSSSTSIDSKTGQPKPRSGNKKPELQNRKGPPPPPDFDANSASLLCSTTDVAMKNYSDEELAGHIQRLEHLIKTASDVLEYWLKRKDSAVGDKEAFEGVIENLVSFAKKSRR